MTAEVALRPAPEPGRGTPVSGTARADRRWPRPSRFDLAVGVAYLLASVYLAMHVLADPVRRVQSHNVNDDVFFQWALAHGARVLTHGVDPFFTRQLNVPAGVNMIANTSILGISLPLAPVTLLFGSGASYALLLVLAPWATSTVWYRVLSRHLTGPGAGAVLGGAFCGFAPGMVAQANGHPNIVAQFLVPLLVWRALRLREPGRAIRNGVALGLVTVWQAFINEEILFSTALAMAIFAACYGLLRRDEVRAAVRPAARGLAVAALVAGALLAYPLLVQFFGAQTYHGLSAGIERFGADVTSFPAFSSQSLGGSGFTRGHFAQNAAEENAFFGWPLLILIGVIIFWLRTVVAVRALGVVALVFALLSLGPQLFIHGRHTHIPGPYALVNHLPVFDTVVSTRLALVIIPVFGILLAYGFRRIGAELPGRSRLIWYALLAAALVPLVPRPLPAIDTRLAPSFVASGEWRRYVAPGHSMVTVPVASSRYVQPMLWSARTGLDLPLAGGYFLGPSSDAKGTAIFGAPARPTSTLLDTVYRTGQLQDVTDRQRADARADLRYWRASIVVLQDGTWHDSLLWDTVNELLGTTGRHIGDAWVWTV
ncbi:MAG TPA: hypothetical protein VJT31_00150 [Rugosimonospora sp.]|nr:hypothetical protein [Rugosimonospora sp.]